MGEDPSAHSRPLDEGRPGWGVIRHRVGGPPNGRALFPVGSFVHGMRTRCALSEKTRSRNILNMPHSQH